MWRIVCIFLFISHSADANYSFSKLRECFLQTQQGELPRTGFARFISEYKTGNEVNTVNALVFQKTGAEQTQVHVIQDINAQNGSTGFRVWHHQLNQHYFPNVRQTYVIPNRHLKNSCGVRPNTGILKLGSRCSKGDDDTRCMATKSVLNIGTDKLCEFTRDTVGNETLPSGTLQLDLTQQTATAVVEDAIVDRLKNVYRAIEVNENHYTREKIEETLLKAIHGPGSCEEVISPASGEIDAHIVRLKVLLCSKSQSQSFPCPWGTPAEEPSRPSNT